MNHCIWWKTDPTLQGIHLALSKSQSAHYPQAAQSSSASLLVSGRHFDQNHTLVQILGNVYICIRFPANSGLKEMTQTWAGSI